MKTPRCARGFMYVEVIIAALILALCALPAANAVRNGLSAAQAGQAKGRELRCIRNHMEMVLAEPYQNLSDAAIGNRSYHLNKDDDCIARDVTVTQVQFDGVKLTPFSNITNPTEVQKDLPLLLVKVSSTDSDYTFSTVVAR
jgi:Tfp pilus assembly protein PilV